MSTVKSFDPELLETRDVHRLLSSSIAPRPIAFASTIDAKGNVNLSPFSFFNVFSSNPPILIFSPARRVRDNTTKHTLQNAAETKEVVINIVDYSIVEQMSESSKEYDKGVNEYAYHFLQIPIHSFGSDDQYRACSIPNNITSTSKIVLKNAHILRAVLLNKTQAE